MGAGGAWAPPHGGLADFVVMEGCLGVPPVWQPRGLGALPGDVGSGLVWLAMSLQQPLPWGYLFFGGGGRGTDGSAKAAQLPPCQQRTELPFTSSHGSDDGLARNTVRLVLPRPTLHSSPGRPPPFPARGRRLQQPGDRAWSLLEGHSLPGASAPYPHAALACFLGGRGCPYPVSPLLSWQRKAGGVVTAAAIREK